MIVITNVTFEHVSEHASSGIAGKSYIDTVMGNLLVGWTPKVNQQFDTIAELQGGLEEALKTYCGKSLMHKRQNFKSEMLRLKHDIETYTQKAEEAAVKVVVKKEIKPFIIPKGYIWESEEPEKPKFAVNVIQHSIFDDFMDRCKKMWNLLWNAL